VGTFQTKMPELLIWLAKMRTYRTLVVGPVMSDNVTVPLVVAVHYLINAFFIRVVYSDREALASRHD
jgi:hypothetical protein